MSIVPVIACSPPFTIQQRSDQATALLCLNKMFSFFDVSWTVLFTSILAALFLWELGWVIYCRTLHPLSKFPGPFLASISRLWLWKTSHTGQLHYVQASLHQRYGKLVRIAPNELACSDPYMVKEIYRTQNPLEKSDFYTTWRSKSFGKNKDHFTVTDEKEHATRRRIVNPIFSMSNVLKSESYIDQCSKMFINKLQSFADKAEHIDLGEWLQMYAFDVIGELYFGRMFGFMETGSDHQDLIRSLDILNPVIAGMAVSATYARTAIVLSAIASSSVRNALKGIDHVTLVTKACVKERLVQIEANNGSEGLRHDMLQQFISIMHEKGDKVDFGILDVEAEIYSGLFAGSDTTAIAMRSVFDNLARAPKVLDSVMTEIDRAFPVAEYPLDRPIAYADAIKLPLLCASIKEAMRLHPSVAFTLPRLSPPEGLLIDGKFIAPGYRVGLNPYIIQRQEEVFGKDPNEFKPERWLVENSSAEQIREMDRSMMIFGSGTRTCIGKNVSLKTHLARFCVYY